MYGNSKECPLVSVIMGVYNSETTLSSAVKSILNQSYSNFEFLICDDASTDDSLQLLSSFKDQRIKILKNVTNQGLAYSLNKCLERCSGHYIARMDADDVAFSTRLQVQVEFLEKHKNIDAVGTAVSVWDGEKIIGVRKFPEFPDKRCLLKSNPFAHPTMMIKRSVYQKLNGYHVDRSTKRAEDLDLWFRFFGHGYTGYNIQLPLLRYTETAADFSKRSFSAAVGIAKVYLRGYRLLRMPIYYYAYCLKPIISSLLPTNFKLYLRRRKLDNQ